jgi:hypothetical protein
MFCKELRQDGRSGREGDWSFLSEIKVLSIFLGASTFLGDLSRLKN